MVERTYRFGLVELGDDYEGRHRGVTLCTIHFENGEQIGWSTPIGEFKAYRDGDGAWTSQSDDPRAAVIAALEQALRDVREIPIVISNQASGAA